MAFTLDEPKLREYLTSADGLDALGLPDDGDGALSPHFDPRIEPSETKAVASAVWNAASDGLITSDVEDQAVNLHAVDDEAGGYTFVQVTIPYGEPTYGVRPSIGVAGETEEARKIGVEGLAPVEQVVAIFREVIDEGNRLLAVFAAAAAASVPAPRVEVLHHRDPDSECTTRIWANGVETTDYAYDDVDPGRGYWAHDIHETIAGTQEGDFSPGYKAASVQAWTKALDSPYTTQS